MLEAPPPRGGLSDSESNLAARLAEADGGRPNSPSYALIARILKEDRSATPDMDLSALLTVLEGGDTAEGGAQSDVTVRIVRDGRGSAGFAFDCQHLTISSVKGDRRELSAMQVGDTIVAVDDVPVATAREYQNAARGVQRFKLTLRRTGARQAADQGPAPESARRRAAPKRPARQAQGGPSEAAVMMMRAAMELDVDRMSYEELLALDELYPPVKQPGLSEAAIQNFPVETICGGGGECAICLEEFYDGDEATCLPCSHMFHIGCAKEWLMRQSRCPYCNLELEG